MPENNQDEILKKIELKSFSNAIALEIGLKIIALAKSQNKKIAVQIDRLHYTVFCYVEEGLSADNHNWMRRKINACKHFETSTLSLKNSLLADKKTLQKPFGLFEEDFLAVGGSIPIFIKEAGMIATITVSGLPDTEDHQIIVDALAGVYF